MGSGRADPELITMPLHFAHPRSIQTANRNRWRKRWRHRSKKSLWCSTITICLAPWHSGQSLSSLFPHINLPGRVHPGFSTSRLPPGKGRCK